MYNYLFLFIHLIFFFFFFFFNDTATTEIYTLSLHDALPISSTHAWHRPLRQNSPAVQSRRSEEHTSELQSQSNLVCRLLLEKKKKKKERQKKKKKKKKTKKNDKHYQIT